MNWQKLQKIIFVAFIILIIGSFLTFEILGYDIDSKEIGRYLKIFGIWAPLIFILIYTLGTTFIPATPFMLIAGILFGFKYGFIYIFIGGVLSSIIVFLVSRKLGKEWVEKILEHRYFVYLNKHNKKLEDSSIWGIMILRMTPIMPAGALSILMGVSRIKTKDYIIGTMIGFLPSTLLTVYFGSLITKII
ncbi:MAG: hypothetical protein A3E02_02545 [Candidatus Zambryskibacteria bacterium RIFCSPHIGHO2_12_FULL_38_34]|uniref:TVP38/TMEM64 family membrane protein n=1 Tax=Candidatus Zambryskibacteria bacterium RIFCSPLOWO2_12_FULL_39_16 TaxID=1802775 RepID=A0A1G2UTC0_9BACT|nr:MAG: hypothetical protein A3D37_00095 [Candidatus Zambryskibacteria bacterium RIFCSPHIGHO2_02_FULL_38_22]OHA97668.1 MAG: hypothetical protein A3E02_02545 [Candidatus Zambryskibacteria bacterium RIFCSPHIGHO2_12_FULL_38_34]OHB08703.1 MAG: hypothetical protein A3I19_01365 [Candidatus Zambryskibacteria bacterium RIFCSPLOWO2_02_FULL_38_13]OHB12641.1 MAG: hypothetical protein A3G46_02185 [Candidatus Zambryskibacteria bacterium RIFCSPLOWO2_12_FULL_39_16]